MTFAHTGHWAIDLLFVLPLFVVVGAIVRDRIREGREDLEAEIDPDPGSRN